ncbi:hypothetical protein M885DRAFT_564531 [Pelagophyceae sp. CCMP2097]|nr:hypothetical protein M885DRAFT_564531 [Pelagophyceae sp. CCMP2097]
MAEAASRRTDKGETALEAASPARRRCNRALGRLSQTVLLCGRLASRWLSSRSDRAKKFKAHKRSLQWKNLTKPKPKGPGKAAMDAIWQDMWRDRLILPRLRGPGFGRNEGKPITYLNLSYRAKACFNHLWLKDKTPIDAPAEPPSIAAQAEPAASVDGAVDPGIATAGKD